MSEPMRDGQPGYFAEEHSSCSISIVTYCTLTDQGTRHTFPQVFVLSLYLRVALGFDQEGRVSNMTCSSLSLTHLQSHQEPLTSPPMSVLVHLHRGTKISTTPAKLLTTRLV